MHIHISVSAYIGYGTRRLMSKGTPPPHAGSPPLSPPACVCHALRAVTRAITQLYDELLRPSGLRVTQFSILGRLSQVGPATVTQLTDMLVMDQTTMTRNLKLLEHEGLIERVTQADARVKSVRLTAKGRKALRAAFPLWQQAQQRVLQQVGAESWAETHRRLLDLLRVTQPQESVGATLWPSDQG